MGRKCRETHAKGNWCRSRAQWEVGGKDNGHFRNHIRALDEHLFVRAWCGKKGTLVGYVLYHSFTPQKLGDMTLEDVRAEGGGDVSVEQFRLDNSASFGPHIHNDTWLWVVRFTFIPLHQVVL